MSDQALINDGAASAAFGGTPDGTMAENSGAIDYFDRKRIRKAMRKGVAFSAYGLYPDGIFDGHVFVLRPITHDFCEAARKTATKHFGKKNYGDDWDSDGMPDWTGPEIRMIKSRWFLSSVLSYTGPPLRVSDGDFDATSLVGAPLRAKLMAALCPDYECGKDWDEEMLDDAFNDSDHDEDFVNMIEKMHKDWKKSIDAVKFLKHLNSDDPTPGLFLVSHGNSS